MIERFILLSFQNLLEKSSKIKNFHINGYLKGVHNQEKRKTSLVPPSIKNVDETSY